MTDTMDPATVLEEAADLLLIRGRCRGPYEDTDGRLCVLGALHAVDPMDESQAELALRMWRQANQGTNTIAPWNDDPATTDDEVRDTLLLAAKDLRNEARHG